MMYMLATKGNQNKKHYLALKEDMGIKTVSNKKEWTLVGATWVLKIKTNSRSKPPKMYLAFGEDEFCFTTDIRSKDVLKFEDKRSAEVVSNILLKKAGVFLELEFETVSYPRPE